MSAPRLVPCLIALRAEFDLWWPDRPRQSDGWIGDQAHQLRKSDHNPDGRGLVHAIDVTAAPFLEEAVQLELRRARNGDETRLTYVIYRRRIWAADDHWRQRVYTGSDPHTNHAHFSASSLPSLERNTGSWHLGDLVTTQFSADDKTELRAAAASIVEITTFAKGGGQHAAVGDAVLNSSFPLRDDTDPRTLVWKNLQAIYRAASSAAESGSDILMRLDQLEAKLDQLLARGQ